MDEEITQEQFQFALNLAAVSHSRSRKGYISLLDEAYTERISWDDRRLRTVHSADKAISAVYILGANLSWDIDRLAVEAIKHNAPLMKQDEALCAATDAFSDLSWHIIGNPFRRCSVPDAWPSAVLQLATALYEGEDCAFAVHDALLEAGCPAGAALSGRKLASERLLGAGPDSGKEVGVVP